MFATVLTFEGIAAALFAHCAGLIEPIHTELVEVFVDWKSYYTAGLLHCRSDLFLVVWEWQQLMG
jgi:hypothetical protein